MVVMIVEQEVPKHCSTALVNNNRRREAEGVAVAVAVAVSISAVSGSRSQSRQQRNENMASLRPLYFFVFTTWLLQLTSHRVSPLFASFKPLLL